MKLYSAIDLHSTNSYIAVLDQDLSVVGQRKLTNDLDAILAFFEPYRRDLEGVAVESTFNWYWLVDGLMDAGYRAHLVNPGAVKRDDGLKYTPRGACRLPRPLMYFEVTSANRNNVS